MDSQDLSNTPMEIALRNKYFMAMAVAQTLQCLIIVQQNDRAWKEKGVPNLIRSLGICLEKPQCKNLVSILNFNPGLLNMKQDCYTHFIIVKKFINMNNVQLMHILYFSV